MIFSVSTAPIRSMSDAVAALQTAAIGHSEVLHIDHDRMLRDYGCLWMLVRCSVRLSRLPEHAAHIETFLRRPTATRPSGRPCSCGRSSMRKSGESST